MRNVGSEIAEAIYAGRFPEVGIEWRPFGPWVGEGQDQRAGACGGDEAVGEGEERWAEKAG